MKQLVFLSHSSLDKPFVRELDRAIRVLGIQTFLDERDIRIGDDIPTRIYEGIEAATHLCYVLSSSSVKSSWVIDELSTAKMREKDEHGLVILPILIEDVKIPLAVRSRRYADFRKYVVGQRMLDFDAFHLLADTLGIKKSDISRARSELNLTSLLNLLNAGADAAIAIDTFRSVLTDVASHASRASRAMPPERPRGDFSLAGFDFAVNTRTENHHSPEGRERAAIRDIFSKNVNELLATIRFSDLVAKLNEYESSVAIQLLDKNPELQSKLGEELVSALQSFRGHIDQLPAMHPVAFLSHESTVIELSRCASLLGAIRRHEFSMLSRRTGFLGQAS